MLGLTTHGPVRPVDTTETEEASYGRWLAARDAITASVCRSTELHWALEQGTCTFWRRMAVPGLSSHRRRDAGGPCYGERRVAWLVSHCTARC
jgi:hypothetical protein